LRARDIALVLNHGVRRPIEVGEYLFRQGDETYEFYVVLSGAVEIIVHAGGTDRVLTRHGPGRFVGELNLVTGLRLFVSGRVVESGEVAASRMNGSTRMRTRLSRPCCRPRASIRAIFRSSAPV
jgi:thioredoxin reductase (NADPH)